jgi:hypothetical protein
MDSKQKFEIKGYEKMINKIINILLGIRVKKTHQSIS